jgi:hypothetical protein
MRNFPGEVDVITKIALGFENSGLKNLATLAV